MLLNSLLPAVFTGENTMRAGNQIEQRFPELLGLFLRIQGPGITGPISHPSFTPSPLLHSAGGAGREQGGDSGRAALGPTLLGPAHHLLPLHSLSICLPPLCFLSVPIAIQGLAGHLCHHKLVCSRVCSVEHLLENVPTKKWMPRATAGIAAHSRLSFLEVLDSHHLLGALKNSIINELMLLSLFSPKPF